MAPVAINLWICGGVTAACWLASVVARDCSLVDRIWSVVPVAHIWVFAARSGDAHTVLVAALVTL